MQPTSKKGPRDGGRASRDLASRRANSKSITGPKPANDRDTESQTFRRAAKAIDASSGEDLFFAQFKRSLDKDRRELLGTIQKKQQDATDADAAFRRQIRAPIADALHPRIAVAPVQTDSTRRAAVRVPAKPAALPAANACPVAASGAQMLQLSKELLASYEEAVKAVKAGGDRLKDAGGRLGDSWPQDVDKLHGLLDVGYQKARDDVVEVLQSCSGDGDDGEADKPKEDAQALTAEPKRKADTFFGASLEKKERERFNVTRSLSEASRGVLRLSRSLPPELVE